MTPPRVNASCRGSSSYRSRHSARGLPPWEPRLPPTTTAKPRVGRVACGKVASDIRGSKISVCEKAIDWDHAMVLVSGQSGRPPAGLTWSTNNMCNLIWLAALPAGFIPPCLPSKAPSPPAGENGRRRGEIGPVTVLEIGGKYSLTSHALKFTWFDLDKRSVNAALNAAFHAWRA
jgi:hypothetical protein